MLSIYGFKSCITAHPESSNLFLTGKVALNIDNLPANLKKLTNNPLYDAINARNWFPLHIYSGFENKPWLVDVLEVELTLLNALKALKLILKILKSCCHRKEILMRKKTLLADLINDQELCKLILRNKGIESLEMYR